MTKILLLSYNANNRHVVITIYIIWNETICHFMLPQYNASFAPFLVKQNQNLISIIQWARVVGEIVARDIAGRDDRRDRGERSTLFSRAHLKLRL